MPLVNFSLRIMVAKLNGVVCLHLVAWLQHIKVLIQWDASLKGGRSFVQSSSGGKVACFNTLRISTAYASWIYTQLHLVHGHQWTLPQKLLSPPHRTYTDSCGWTSPDSPSSVNTSAVTSSSTLSWYHYSQCALLWFLVYTTVAY